MASPFASVKVQVNEALLIVSVLTAAIAPRVNTPMLLVPSVNPGRSAVAFEVVNADDRICVSIRSTSVKVIVSVATRSGVAASSVTAPTWSPAALVITARSFTPVIITVTSRLTVPPWPSLTVAV